MKKILLIGLLLTQSLSAGMIRIIPINQTEDGPAMRICALTPQSAILKLQKMHSFGIQCRVDVHDLKLLPEEKSALEELTNHQVFYSRITYSREFLLSLRPHASKEIRWINHVPGVNKPIETIAVKRAW